jgi:hypothetical protein
VIAGDYSSVFHDFVSASISPREIFQIPIEWHVYTRRFPFRQHRCHDEHQTRERLRDLHRLFLPPR